MASFLEDWMARSADSEWADDQAFAGDSHDLRGDRRQLIDLDDALNLREESLICLPRNSQRSVGLTDGNCSAAIGTPYRLRRAYPIHKRVDATCPWDLPGKSRSSLTNSWSDAQPPSGPSSSTQPIASQFMMAR